MRTEGYPEILAPAGDEMAFLAALAAGSDAIYCGLKSFSARKAAKNLTVKQLARLTELARRKNTKVYVAFNTLLLPQELLEAQQLLIQISRYVKPDALIFQDLAVPALARSAGFVGELHLSTLGNGSHSAVLELASKLNISRIVMPRELSVDELKQMSNACPNNVSLEVFVHGALCYGVSGRCYWSSFMGGKSGLRGACVQPCRRLYQQEKQISRAYSCADLGLDTLVKVLKKVEKVSSWKIEGRKKGPHYVYYTALAYQLLRDEGDNPKTKKEALGLLEMALGRKRTHYGFLSHRPWHPIPKDGQTTSGLWVGGIRRQTDRSVVSLKEALFPGDLLRIGTEDEPWHETVRVLRSVPKGGTFSLKLPPKVRPPAKTPVFLVDRRESELLSKIKKLQVELEEISISLENPATQYKEIKKTLSKGQIREICVQREMKKTKLRSRGKKERAVWLTPEMTTVPLDTWVFLPPIVFPENEKVYMEKVRTLVQKKHQFFMLGDPWQINWFKNPLKLNIWAGPFCNVSNFQSATMLVSLGVKGIIASPELGWKDYVDFAKSTPLPLGVVEKGLWPLSIARIEPRLKKEILFESPKKEGAFWVQRENLIWTYPNWQLDFSPYRKDFEKIGYQIFLHFEEKLPSNMSLKKRSGNWNLKNNLI